MLNTGGREKGNVEKRRKIGERYFPRLLRLIRRFSNESFESRFTSHLVKHNLSANKHRCVHPLDDPVDREIF